MGGRDLTLSCADDEPKGASRGLPRRSASPSRPPRATGHRTQECNPLTPRPRPRAWGKLFTAYRRCIYYAGEAAAAYGQDTAVNGGAWRATPDEDEHYSYAVALR
jgi:hypothetical protein